MHATPYSTSQEKYTDLLTSAVDISAQLEGLHYVGADLLSTKDVYDAQKYYSDLSREDRRTFCSTAFVGGALTTGYPGNHMLCQTCFCKCHGIALATFKRVAKTTKDGRRSWHHRRKGDERGRQAHNHAGLQVAVAVQTASL